MRVIFLDFDGVLHAVAGPPATMQLFVWAPLLDAILDEFPATRLVIHASARDYTPRDTMAKQLGKLGEKVIGVVKPRIRRWEAIQLYLDANPEITDYRILDDMPKEFPAGLPALIECTPNRGISSASVQLQIRNWLSSG
ncbi:MAG TPA: HAD domain-containing protein [Burkholderiaceae bacterium]